MKLFLAAHLMTDEVKMFLNNRAREAFIELAFEADNEIWIAWDGEPNYDLVTAAAPNQRTE